MNREGGPEVNRPRATADDDPTRWMLGGDPPAPQTDPDRESKKIRKAIEDGTLNPSDTHTGTDPLGRAIGPAEDPTEIKKVRNEKGNIVTPDRPTKKTARKRT